VPIQLFKALLRFYLELACGYMHHQVNQVMMQLPRTHGGMKSFQIWVYSIRSIPQVRMNSKNAHLGCSPGLSLILISYTAAESSLYFQDGKCLFQSVFMMLLLNALSPDGAFDNWMRIEGHLRHNSSAGKVPRDEVQRLFEVAESSLVRFQGDGCEADVWRCSACNFRGCRVNHPELRREFQMTGDSKIGFIPVSEDSSLHHMSSSFVNHSDLLQITCAETFELLRRIRVCLQVADSRSV
jgi:hypothetical protein